jgi:uncharacterized membrane protein YecN with MAPEG domain
MVNAADATYYALYTIPPALLLLGVLEYNGYSHWLLHILFFSLTTAEILQSFRDATTYYGKMAMDVGELTVFSVLVVSSILSVYTLLTN